jgi:hypothetical protein
MGLLATSGSTATTTSGAVVQDEERQSGPGRRGKSGGSGAGRE